MLILLIDIFIEVRVHKRAVTHSIDVPHGAHKIHQHKNLQIQMLILMLTSIFIFLITTLPIAIYRITSVRQKDLSSSFFRIMTIWAALGWFQSLNYAVCISFLYNLYLFTVFAGELL